MYFGIIKNIHGINFDDTTKVYKNGGLDSWDPLMKGIVTWGYP